MWDLSFMTVNEQHTVCKRLLGKQLLCVKWGKTVTQRALPGIVLLDYFDGVIKKRFLWKELQADGVISHSFCFETPTFQKYLLTLPSCYFMVFAVRWYHSWPAGGVLRSLLHWCSWGGEKMRLKISLTCNSCCWRWPPASWAPNHRLVLKDGKI